RRAVPARRRAVSRAQDRRPRRPPDARGAAGRGSYSTNVWRIARLIALALLAACGAKKHAAERHDAGSAAPVAIVVDAALPADAASGAVRSEHVAFDFVDNRHAAHRAIAGELVVDAGDIGFARYTRFGLPVPHWHLGHAIDNERVAIADRFATLEVPLPVAARE